MTQFYLLTTFGFSNRFSEEII
uniref:Uncharacterized protein n=1 Tax=Arundo donax TaxID=35708 RepID=A0A0A9BVB3_ARUDO